MASEEFIIPIKVERDDDIPILPASNVNVLTSLIINATPDETSTNTRKSEEIFITDSIPKNTTSVPIPTRIIPTHNVPERIIICLDTCQDPEFTAFKLGDGSKYSPLYMFKRTIEIFVKNKSFIDSRHKFALMTLDAKAANWKTKFTNNCREIMNCLNDIEESEPSDEFDLGALLKKISEIIPVPNVVDLRIKPPYVVRVIILYSRSYCLPVFVKQNFKQLLTNPYFTVDVIMTHEETPIEDKKDEIFNSLRSIDEKGFSYSFNVGRNPTALHDAMAKVLSHPLQRPIQQLAVHKITIPDKEEEE